MTNEEAETNEAGRLVHDGAALHAGLFTIDTHSDTPTNQWARPAWDFSARHERAVDRSQIDLPRMDGAADAMVFAVYVGQMGRSDEGLRVAHELAWRHFERAHEVLRANAAGCGLALSADDAVRLKAEGRRAIFLSIENSYSLGRDPANVEKFHQLGVRMIGLTHMLNNDVADASTDPRGAEWGGLSPLGREIVSECNRLGIVLDASHASDAVLWQLLEISRAPVICSHSDCRAVCDHPRNIGDDLLRALAAKGGVLAINALPVSVAPEGDQSRTEAIKDVLRRFRERVPDAATLAEEDKAYEIACAGHANPRATLADFVRHVEHAAKVGGIDAVGIGCDFDGGGGVEGLDSVDEFPNLTRTLLARGWTEPMLAKLWGGNVLRLFRAVEKGAR
ncbi:MAG: dipeptidase [Verrucomicrobia bacterium]|nr:dipeptidase [Verrucomicrobiota bacterium]